MDNIRLHTIAAEYQRQAGRNYYASALYNQKRQNEVEAEAGEIVRNYNKDPDFDKMKDITPKNLINAMEDRK